MSSLLPEIIIPALPLGRFAAALLEAAGTPPNHAAVVADSLVAANLRAVDSHGVRLLVDYDEALRTGRIDPNATGRVVSETGACALIDGQSAFGQVVSAQACEIAIRLGQEHGIGIVSVRESNHFGAAAYWTARMAQAGMIGVAMTNASPGVFPWQGKDKRIGTNPISMALPGPDIWLLDMATSTVALNRIWKAAEQGEATIPAGWALDRDGVPTTDTKAAQAGSPMPLGGYKGTGLAVMVEILCGVLSGGAIGTEVGGTRVKGRKMRTGHTFIALQVARFMPVDDFVARIGRLRDMIKSSTPAAGYDEVLMAGEPEWRAETDRRKNGIPISLPIWNELLELAGNRHVTVPEVASR